MGNTKPKPAEEPAEEPNRKKRNAPDLKLVKAAELAESVNKNNSFDGGGAKPPSTETHKKDPFKLLEIFVWGLIMLLISLCNLNAESTSAELHRNLLPSMRIWAWDFGIISGSAIMATAVAIYIGMLRAERIEKGLDGKLKSLGAKRLEKMSIKDILSIIGNAIGSYLKYL